MMFTPRGYSARFCSTERVASNLGCLLVAELRRSTKSPSFAICRGRDRRFPTYSVEKLRFREPTKILRRFDELLARRAEGLPVEAAISVWTATMLPAIEEPAILVEASREPKNSRRRKPSFSTE